METESSSVVPLLVVRGARQAVDFYVRALGASISACYEHGAKRRISHADLTLDGARFAVTEEAREWNSDAPPSLGGSPVVMQLHVADTDAVVAAMGGAGATIVFPAQELLGERMARVRDPFGHLWLLRQRVEDLATDELQRRRDDLFAQFAQRKPPSDAASPRARVEESPTLDEPPPAPQAPNARIRAASSPTARPGTVHLVLGPVGAGKSTFALRLANEHSALRFALDDWMTTLFSPDRPLDDIVEWYVERSARCIEQIWKLAKTAAAAGTPVALEIGLLRRNERESFYARVEDAGLPLIVYVLDAARPIRRERVMQRNGEAGPTFSMVVPNAVFELASDRWEPPDATEVAGREMHVVRTDSGAL